MPERAVPNGGANPMREVARIRRHREIMRLCRARARLQATGELRRVGSRYTPLAARHSL